MQSATIDWLSFTFKEPADAANYFALRPCSDPETTTSGKFGYRYGHSCAHGVLRLTDLANSQMGTHYIYPGSALAALYNDGSSPFDVLRKALSCKAKVTRLDLAKDVTKEGIQLEEIWEAIQAGHYTGTSQAHSRIQSDAGGYTIYIGSRTSEKFIRVYDKGAQLNNGQDWKRCEVELKGDVAKQVARIISQPSNSVGAVFDDLTRRMFDCQSVAWKSFRGDIVPLSVPKIEKLADRETWIAQQVIGAALAHLKSHPDSQALYNLYRALDRHYRKLQE